MSNNVNGTGPNFGPSYEKAYAGQKISVDHVNKASQAGRKNAITTIVGDAQIARGPSGTSIVLPKPRRTSDSWLVNRVGKQIRVLLGNIYNGRDEEYTVRDLARITDKNAANAEKAYFQYTDCDVADAKYDEYNQVWTFPKTDVTTDMIIWIDLNYKKKNPDAITGPKNATLKYTDKDTYKAKALLGPTVVIATLLKNETVLQAVYGDIWAMEPEEPVYHPFQIVRLRDASIASGTMQTYINQGSVFSYPNGKDGFVNISGNSDDGSYPNAPMWATGGYMKTGLTKITDPSNDYQVFLEFERKVLLKEPQGEDQTEYTDWAYPNTVDLPNPNAPEVSSRWICKLRLGDMEPNLLYGNYNINVNDPPDPSNYKELKSIDVNVTGTLSGGIGLGDIPIKISQKQKTYGIKFFSYGKQQYLIATIKVTSGTGPNPEPKYTIVQNLLSDFFFYPPLDNRCVFWDSQVFQVSSDTGLPPNPDPPPEPPVVSEMPPNSSPPAE